MRPLIEALTPAIRGLGEITRSALDNLATVKAVVPLVADLVAADDWLPAEARRIVPEKNYAIHAVYLDPEDRFSILSVVWKPLADTPIHDHVVAIAIQVYGANFTQVGGRHRYEPDGTLVPTRTVYDSVAGVHA